MHNRCHHCYRTHFGKDSFVFSKYPNAPILITLELLLFGVKMTDLEANLIFRGSKQRGTLRRWQSTLKTGSDSKSPLAATKYSPKWAKGVWVLSIGLGTPISTAM